jgi:hypothetical protein
MQGRVPLSIWSAKSILKETNGTRSLGRTILKSWAYRPQVELHAQNLKDAIPTILFHCDINSYDKQTTNKLRALSKRTIPTERLPLVDEI